MLNNREIVIKKLKRELPFLKTKYGVIQIGLFGSCATEKDNKSSDIDLYIEFKEPLGFAFFELSEYLEKKLRKKVDIITSAGLNSIRIENVKKSIEGTTIYVQ